MFLVPIWGGQNFLGLYFGEGHNFWLPSKVDRIGLIHTVFVRVEDEALSIVANLEMPLK